MAMQSPARADAPLSAINTTPLIDVLLVLLIMLVITIPVATHQVDFDLPSQGPRPHGPLNRDVNRLTITGSEAIIWNGTPLTRDQLAANLAATAAMRPEPELQFRPDADASYDMSAKVLHQIKQSQVTRFGFVGNEQFLEFGKPVTGSGTEPGN